MDCDRCKRKITKEESFLVYYKKKYCKECIVWMVFKKGALPNDGSILGGKLAKELSTGGV